MRPIFQTQNPVYSMITLNYSRKFSFIFIFDTLILCLNQVLSLHSITNYLFKNNKYQIIIIHTMSTQKKEKGLQKYSFRGYTPEQLNELNQEQLVELFRARQRRRFARKIKHKYNRLYLKCKKSKKNTQPGEKPAPVKTHLRDAIIMPDMVGNFVAVYNGKAYNIVEVKFDMIGRYLGEFSLTYKATRHGKAGVGATKGSAHTSLK